MGTADETSTPMTEVHEYCLVQLQMGQNDGNCQNAVTRIRNSISSILPVDSLHHAGRDSSMLLIA